MPQRPMILFVHGAWHTRVHYQKFIDILEAKGNTVVAPDLPSGLEPMPANPTEADIKLIADKAKELADKGFEIIAVSHSYGGLVSTEAFSGLGLSSRAAQGLPGGVRTIICIAGFLLGPGMTLDSVGPLPADGTGWAVYEDSYKTLNHSHDIGALFYPDLPKEDQERWCKLTVKHPKATSFYVPKSFSYSEIETVFVYCEKDVAFPVAIQRAMVHALESNGAKVKEESLPSGHFPSLSMPEKLADIILKYCSRSD